MRDSYEDDEVILEERCDENYVEAKREEGNEEGLTLSLIHI